MRTLKKYLISLSPLIILTAIGCTIRAVALIETEDAAVSGETTIQRKQDPQVERQHSLFENIINKEPAVMSVIPTKSATQATVDTLPEPVLPATDPEVLPAPTLNPTPVKPPLFTDDELKTLFPSSKSLKTNN